MKKKTEMRTGCFLYLSWSLECSPIYIYFMMFKFYFIRIMFRDAHNLRSKSVKLKITPIWLSLPKL